MIFLVIKGSPAQARAAMAQRAIPWNDSFIQGAQNETFARTSGENRAKVTAWFAEGGDAPYPCGTLLLFRDFAP
jgi:hypothetical protein